MKKWDHYWTKIEKAIPVNIPSSPVKPEPSHKNKPTEEKKSSSSLLSSYVSRKQEKKQQDTRSGTLSNYVSRKPNLQFQVKDLTQNLLQNQHINTNHGNSS